MHIGKKVIVLIHEKDKMFISGNPFMKLLMKEWKDMGFSVEVVWGVNRFVDADLLINHINLTIVPDEYVNFMDQYPIVINQHVKDTSKSKISTNIIEKNDDYYGPVIIKTKYNYGGLPETRISSKNYLNHSFLSSFTSKLVSNLLQKSTVSWRLVKTLDPNKYPVYSSLKEMPKSIFDNGNLIVEKFLPEVEAGKYCLRSWLFFGDKDINTLSRSNEMIVKGSNKFQREEVPVPVELYSIRQKLRFDYGNFDYVLRDGEVVLFDVNRTPTTCGNPPSLFIHKAAHLLARGIWSQMG